MALRLAQGHYWGPSGGGGGPVTTATAIFTADTTSRFVNPEVTVDEYGLASPYPSADMSDLTAHVNAILGEVGNDLSAWEGYNEPDFAYEGSMADLVTMQQTIWNAVKAWNTAHSTDIKVLSPAFSTRAHIEGAEDSMTVQGFYLAGGYDYCDAVAFHPYNSGDAGGVGVDRDSAAVLLGGLVNIGLDKPIWLTEMGRSNAATLTSLELKRHFLMWRALGVPVAFWYSWDIASLNDMRLSNNPAAWTGMVNDLVGPTFGWVSYYNDGSSAQLGALIDGVPTLI